MYEDRAQNYDAEIHKKYLVHDTVVDKLWDFNGVWFMGLMTGLVWPWPI